MNKKTLFVFFASAAMILAGCGPKGPTHGAKQEWNHDETHHWHDCVVEGCTEHKYDEAAHSWDQGVVTKQPTCIAKGETTYTCTVCQETKTVEDIPMTAHQFSNDWSSDETYHWKGCIQAGCDAISQKAEHTWDSGEVVIPPTCHSKGSMKYTCTVCGKVVYQDIEMTEHNFSEQWSTDDNFHWHVCLNEGCTEIDQKGAHDWGEGVVTKPATCTEAGNIHYVCGVCGKTKDVEIPATGHEGMRHVEETIPTHEQAGTLSHYYCDDCEKYFKDEDGLLPIDDPTSLVITSPVISKTYANANFSTFDIINQKEGSGEKHKDGSGGYAAWFNINEDQGKGAVYVEAELKLTKNAAYSDIGFIIATEGKTNINRVVRAGLYIPDANNNLATAARIRTTFEDGSSIKDQVEIQDNFASNVNVKNDFIKVAMYRKGKNLVLFANDKIVAGMNVGWQKWANAADETVAYKYGIFGQNISDMYYQNAKFEYGDEATALYEALAMNKIMPNTKAGTYGAFKYATGDHVWNNGSKTSAVAPFLTSEAQQVQNTYVEGMFKAKAVSGDSSASFGFMITKPNTSADGKGVKSDIVLRAVLYLHNASGVEGGLVTGLKIKCVKTSDGSTDTDIETKNGVIAYADATKGVKFAMYRAGTTVKLYLNNQEVYSRTDGWSESATLLATADQKMVYSIWQQNLTETDAYDLVLKTGDDADNAVKDLVATDPINVSDKFGNYSLQNINPNATNSLNGKKIGMFDRRLFKESVYNEVTFKITSSATWSAFGLMIVDPRAQSIGTDAAERFAFVIKHNVNDTQGNINKILVQCNEAVTPKAAHSQDVFVGQTFPGGVDIKLGLYRNNEKIIIVLNDVTFEVPATAYSWWTDFADSSLGYNYGFFTDHANTTAEAKNYSLLTGAAADAKIQSLLPQE